VSWTLRRATAEDTDAMSETLAIGFDGYRAFAAPGWQPPDVRSAPELARMRARLQMPSTWAMIAEEDGLVAGHVGFIPQPGVPGGAHLWQLFLRPPWWGTGLAAVLLRAALDAATAAGYRRMRFYTPRDQARARAFYEREGFSHTGWEGLEEPLGLVLVEYALEPLVADTPGHG
jgi:GNAT superfamily N-acetyltransferase